MGQGWKNRDVRWVLEGGGGIDVIQISNWCKVQNIYMHTNDAVRLLFVIVIIENNSTIYVLKMQAMRTDILFGM